MSLKLFTSRLAETRTGLTDQLARLAAAGAEASPRLAALFQVFPPALRLAEAAHAARLRAAEAQVHIIVPKPLNLYIKFGISD